MKSRLAAKAKDRRPRLGRVKSPDRDEAQPEVSIPDEMPNGQKGSTTEAAAEVGPVQPVIESCSAESAEDRVESLDVTVEESQNRDDSDEDAEEGEPSAEPDDAAPRQRRWVRVLAFAVLPTLVLLVALAGAYARWQNGSRDANNIARMESVQAARDTTVAILAYKPETVEQQLIAARDRLTGQFRDSYSSLTHDVVIPGAKQKQISATVTIPAAAPVSATPTHAVVLVFVDQTVMVGADPPTDTASVVRVTLDKVANRWLVSAFDPI